MTTGTLYRTDPFLNMSAHFHDGTIWRLFFIPILSLAISGCAGKPIEAFKNERPILHPESYFAGHDQSWGIIESRSGQPIRIIHTETWGHWDGNILHFEQDIFFDHGTKQHRSWQIRRLDDHNYSATGTGIVGTAHGKAYGNIFHLDFTLDAMPGNPLGRVHMSQWMYLQSDGVTLVNRDTLTKAGVIIVEITEQFQKDR